MAIEATRVGDRDSPHCSGMRRAKGARTVFVNGRPWSCLTHPNTTHDKYAGDKCIPHTAVIVSASKTVFAENLPVGRIGDDVGPDCTHVAQGSDNVFAG